MSALSWIRARRWTPYDAVRVALGLLLLVAAALKAHQLATEPVIAPGILNSLWFLTAVVELELFFGLWLVAGLYPRQTWAVAVACFALFAGVSLFKGLSGAATCGCFGRVPVNPWWTLILDAAAVSALLFARPVRAASFNAPTRTYRRVYLCSFVAASTTLAVATGVTIRPKSIQLEVDKQYLDFGEVWAQSDFKWRLPVHNNSSRAITLDWVRVSCKCAQVSPRSFTIGPGETTDIQLTMNLMSAPSSRSPGAPVEIAEKVAAGISGSGRSDAVVVWEVRGRVRQALDFVPDRVTFADDVVEGEKAIEQCVRVRCLQPVSSLTARCVPPIAAVSVSRCAGDGEQFELRVTPSSDLPAGAFEAQLRVSAVLKPTGGDPIVQSLPVTGTIVPDIGGYPGSLVFGAVPIGTTVSDYLQLESHSVKSAALISVQSDSACVSVSPVPESQRPTSANVIGKYTVNVAVNEPGPHGATVSASVRVRGDEQCRLVRIPVRWHGVARTNAAGREIARAPEAALP